MGLRKERLADEIRDLLGVVFSGGTLTDPRLEGVAITHVQLSADLQVASVYYRSYGETEVVKIQEALEGCASFLKKHLSGKLTLHRVPKLRFFYDESIEKASRIEGLLEELKKQSE
ncbi:MAG: 30S ribosome-binding factor RbfA [Zetaproteobacteria bacterium]|nr:30S ribosome-binding factor RbfA [Zetaproteobacteria bacterium]